jgi:hypothetical protein
MRKRLIVAALVFVAAFAFGLATPDVAGAADCFFACDCAGTPLRCCVVNGVTSCKPDTSGVWQCPQVYNC